MNMFLFVSILYVKQFELHFLYDRYYLNKVYYNHYIQYMASFLFVQYQDKHVSTIFKFFAIYNMCFLAYGFFVLDCGYCGLVQSDGSQVFLLISQKNTHYIPFNRILYIYTS